MVLLFEMKKIGHELQKSTSTAENAHSIVNNQIKRKMSLNLKR